MFGFDVKASNYPLDKLVGFEDTIKKFDKLLKLKWEFRLSHGQYGIPQVVNGIAFLPEEINFAVDVESGEKLLFDNTEHQKIIKSRCSDSLIYLYDDNISHLIDIYHDKEIIFYNKPLAWQYDKREVFVKNSILIQIIDEQELKAIYFKNMWDRKILWHKKLNSRVRGFILTKDSLAFVSDFEYFYILNKKNGTELWKKEAKEGIQSSQYVIGNLLYVITYKDEKTRELWCVDIKQFNLMWKYEIPSTGIRQTLHIDKNNVYCIGDAGIYCIDRMNGKFQSLFKGNYIPWYISAINDFIIVYDRDVDKKMGYYNEIITAVDKETGKTTFQYFTSKGFPYEPPKYSPEDLKIFEQDGSLTEIREISRFDYGLFSFVEVPNSNIVIALYDTYLVAFEVIGN